MRIQPDPGKELDLAALPRLIHDAGFRPGEMWIRGVGRIDGERFRLRGWSRDLALEHAAQASGTVSLEARVDYTSGLRLVEVDARP